MSKAPRTFDLDAVIAELRGRIGSPEQRTDHPASVLGVKMRDLGISGMMEKARELAAMVPIIADTMTTDPERQMEQVRAHRIAEEIDADRNTVADIPAAPVATEEDFESAELALGLKLPKSLRRLYGEVANGGFGPCHGLLPLAGIVKHTHGMRRAPSEGFPFEWPAHLIVIEEPSPYSHNLNVRTGEVVAFDGDPVGELDWDEASDAEMQEAWGRSFETVAPNMESWLGAWMAGPDPEEVAAQAAAQEAWFARESAKWKAHWRAQVEKGIADTAKKSVEERRAMGLPDLGWEDEMRRGAGVLDG